MDIINLLKSINNLSDFLAATQVITTTDRSSLKIQFNLSTVLALKYIQSFEVEYFNKYNESGVAIKMFELILQMPPSNTWGVVGDELVCIIQYWLEAVRKHLISHNIYWWNFLSTLLNFIQAIYKKHSLIVNCLVERTADCLLDLATRSEPRAEQRYIIIQTFNKYCASASRQFRLAMKLKFEKYFVLISSIMATCGDVRIQYSMMETLIRWLLPRQDFRVRETVAASWFPIELYTRQTIKVFLERPWQHFFRDTRNFLNAHNEKNDSVLSVICRKLSFGTVEILSGPREYWLDLNSETKCLSVMLEPSLFKPLAISNQDLPVCDALVIKEENTTAVQMNREPRQIYISLKVVDPLRIFPSKVLENNYDIHATISSRSDLQSVDKALRNIFNTKYQVILRNEDRAEEHQRYDSSQTLDYISEEDSRFSNPPVVLQQRQSTRQSDQRTASARQSHSSVSTSSLATLRERLSAFPEHGFGKELEKVSAIPLLNSVSEVTEIEEKQSQSTDKLKPCICPSNKEDNISQREEYSVQNSKYNENPDVENINDLLAQKALQFPCLEETRKSQSQQSVAVNIIPTRYKSAKSRICNRKFINDSTDESSSAFIENTLPVHIELKENTNISASITAKERVSKSISLKRKKLLTKTDESSMTKPKINNNKSSAKINNININKSIESLFHRPLNNVDFNYIETEECLNAVVDKIREEFKKTLIKNRNKITNKVIPKIGVKKVPFKEVTYSKEKSNKKTHNKLNRKAETKEIKLKFPNSKKQMETQRPINKIKNDDKILFTINSKGVENESIQENDTDLPRKITGELGNTNKKKRKLYSSKDEDIINAKIGIHVSETEEDISVFPEVKTLITTSKFHTTTYKESEMNDGSVRQLRNRKYFSSKTDKNDIFDELKKTIDGETNIKLVDTNVFGKDGTVYNFTSGSEDGDFKTISNVPNTTITGKTLRPRITKNVNLDSKCSSRSESDSKNIKRKNSKRQRVKKQLSRKRSREIVDERMRKAPIDVLNTSFLIGPEIDELSVEPEPLHKKPKMISISDEKECEIFSMTDNKTQKQYGKNTNIRSRNKKFVTNNEFVASDKAEDREVSPLPCLVIETVQKIRNLDDSVTGTMLEKFKDIYNSDQLPDVSEVPEVCGYNSKMNSSKLCNNENVTSRRMSTESDTTKSDNNQIVITLNKLDLHAASLSTIGKSPITAHGISNEMPPDVRELNKKISRRSLDTQDLTENALNYYNLLNEEINESLNNLSKKDPHNKVGKDDSLTNKPRISPERFKINWTPSVCITRLSPSVIDKYLDSSKDISTTETSNNIVTRQKSRSSLRFNSGSGKSNDEDEISNKPSVQNVRVSTISPINLERELNQIIKNRDDFIKSPIDNESRACKLDNLNTSTSNITSCITKNPSKADSNMQSSKGSNDKSLAVVTDGTQTVNFKRPNINAVFENIYSSGPTGSSVKDWLLDNDRLEKADKGEKLKSSLIEILLCILEKLNTTLGEILYNTRESLLKMFVDNQARLEQFQMERENMSKEIRKDIISIFVNVVDEKFAEMNRRSIEQEEIIQSEMTQRARTILRNFIRQKQDMVELLREDIQAAIDRICGSDKSS